MKMKALVYTEKGRIELQNRKIPELADGEALIRVKGAGICGTDLTILAGKHPRVKAPLIMGHEFWGEIEDIASISDTEFVTKENVTAVPLIPCGHCIACRSGFSYVCQNLKMYGIDRDGAFAEYVKLPINSLVKLPEELDKRLGVLIEPMAVAVHALRLSSIKLGDTVCVLGGGPIGLLIALLAKNSVSDKVLLFEQEPYRISLAKEYGLSVFNVKEDDPMEIVSEYTNGAGADVVFEAAGVSSTVQSALPLCRVRGEIMSVGVPKTLVPYDMLTLSFKEVTIKGVRVYAPFDFERAIQIAAFSRIDFSRMISKPFSLEDGVGAFESALSRKNVMRVIFEME